MKHTQHALFNCQKLLSIDAQRHVKPNVIQPPRGCLSFFLLHSCCVDATKATAAMIMWPLGPGLRNSVMQGLGVPQVPGPGFPGQIAGRPIKNTARHGQQEILGLDSELSFRFVQGASSPEAPKLTSRRYAVYVMQRSYVTNLVAALSMDVLLRSTF